jgi:outer membrane lipoprotein carrier protein
MELMMIARNVSSFALAGAMIIGAVPSAMPGAVPRPASAHAARQGDLLDRAVAAWAKVKTARATFEQTIVNPLTGSTLTSTGEYQQQRPGKLSVKFDNPATDRIVADGKYVWLYLPSSVPNQVIRTRLGSGGTGTVDLSAQFLTAPRSRYTVTEASPVVVNGRSMRGYTLVPRTPGGAPFKSATVHIDDADATVRQFVVTEANGVQRTVRLTSFRSNVPVDAGVFVFTPPPDTRVVER